MSAMTNIPAFCASDLGKAIRNERKKLKFTQQRLAEVAGCRRETIIAMEAGDNISVYTLMSILGALGKGLRICDTQIEFEQLSDIFGDDD